MSVCCGWVCQSECVFLRPAFPFFVYLPFFLFFHLGFHIFSRANYFRMVSPSVTSIRFSLLLLPIFKLFFSVISYFSNSKHHHIPLLVHFFISFKDNVVLVLESKTFFHHAVRFDYVFPWCLHIIHYVWYFSFRRLCLIFVVVVFCSHLKWEPITLEIKRRSSNQTFLCNKIPFDISREVT